MKEALIIGTVAFLTLLIIAMMASSTARVASDTAVAMLDSGTRTTVIHNIVLPEKRNRVVIDAGAGGLQNAWIDIDYSLVEQKSQESYDAYALAEYYSGTDSDGSWTEGDTSPTATLSSIPRGTYDLVIETSAKRWINPNQSPGSFWDSTLAPAEPAPVDVAITVSRGGVFGGNLVLCLILITLWPVILVLLHLSFENRRKASIAESED
jgi:hypothetical protein